MRSLLEIRHFVRPYKIQITVAILTLIAVAGSRLVIPTIIREVIDTGLALKDIDFLVTAALIIFGIGIVRAVLELFQRYLSEFVSMRVAYDLRNKLFDHIQKLSFTYHNHAQTGQLMNRCTEDVRSVQRFISFGFVDLSYVTLIFIGTGILMFIDNPKLALIAFIPLFPLVLLTTDFGKRASQLFYNVDKSLGDLSARLQENVAGAQVVRAFSREEYEINRFDRTNRQLYDARITVIGEWSKVMPTTNLLIVLSTILILWFGGQQVIAGETTIGQLVAFNSYILLLALPAQQLTWMVNSAGEAAAGVKRVFEVLDQDPKISSPENPYNPNSISGKVEFKEVTFTYQGEDSPALEQISFTALPNQVIALIGATGSGKSSLVNLIPRFYDVNNGAVLIDDQNIKNFDLELLRQQIGIVLQTSLLFSASIKENIAFGRPNASEEEIVRAAEAAQAHTFISEMPNGYDTVVGERGITLSGGQRQRVAIARALLIDPRILILDDSTSSVDTETEYRIQEALDALMRGRTTFVIAQRLSTVRNADLILVMENGKIIERGVHQDLLKMNGHYKEIYDLQLAQQEKFREEVNMLESRRNDKG